MCICEFSQNHIHIFVFFLLFHSEVHCAEFIMLGSNNFFFLNFVLCCAWSLSRARLPATPWTAAPQAPRPPCRGLDLSYPPALLPPILPDPSLGATEGRGGEGRGARSHLSHHCLVPSGGCSALRGTEKPVQQFRDSQPSGAAPTLHPGHHPLPGLHSLTF